MSNTTKPQWTLLSICIEKIADTIEGYQALPVPAELKEKLLNKLLTKEEILDKDVNLALFLDADIKKIDLTYYIQRQSLASFTELFASFHSTLTHLAVNNYSNLSNEHAKVIATCKSLEFLDLRRYNNCWNYLQIFNCLYSTAQTWTMICSPLLYLRARK